MRSRTLSKRVRAVCAAAAAVILPMVGMSVGTQAVAASRATVRTIQKGASVQFAAAAPAGNGFITGEIPAPDLESRANNRPSGAAPQAATSLAATSLAASPTAASSALTAQGAASRIRLKTSFEGLNHRAQRTANGGNQFSLEPPDQGMCVNEKYVLETINDVTRVYHKDGTPASAVVDLNTFYGYPAEVNRTTGLHGQFPTDPSCLYDHATQRWFMVILTLETDPVTGGFTGANHFDIAVSQTSSPVGGWNIYRLAVQDDGTAGTPNHRCSFGPCIGDYPHIGADANGFYITANEYSFFGPEFHGAQVYAFSKAALAQGVSSVFVTQFDTHGLDRGNSGFTIWPAQSPGVVSETAAGGTEYFLSSNAADEAHGDGTLRGPRQSTEILAWALTNTSSLIGGNPQPFLSMTHLDVNLYATPPASNQKLTGPFPLMDCLNTDSCAKIVIGHADPYKPEVPASLDSNDTRMQQVTFAHGLLWGALDTAITVNHEVKAGIEWFTVKPSVATGSVSGAVHSQGYMGLAGNNLTYPAVGVTTAGKAAIAFTIVGTDYFPSAGYARLSSSTGAGPIEVAALGAGPQDGFSGYKAFSGSGVAGVARPRWGDYGAAASDGNSIWLASEYIGQSCTLAQYMTNTAASPFGSCDKTRTALANWDTRISQVVVQ